MNDNQLTEKERLVSFILINFYELLLGFSFGMLFNEISYSMLSHNQKEKIFITLIMMLIMGIMFITSLLYIRIIVDKFPGLNELSSKEGYSHPPPIALKFGFWMTQNQLRSRSQMVKNYFFSFIKRPEKVIAKMA